MFKVIQQGLFRSTTLPSYGNQDVGVTPGGAMDRFSYLIGNIILGNPENSEALEIIFPPKLEAIHDGYFILTGANYTESFISSSKGEKNIKHGEVHKIQKGEIITLGKCEKGFRTYLCYRKSTDLKKDEKLINRKRGPFKKTVTWYSTDNTIRVIKGPEYKYLDNPENLLNNYWKITNDSGNMGIRLESDSKLTLNMGNMISEAVADGTIQITPKGPIILLRHRQTVGGYPRCFNVIQADVDRLAQYKPGEIIRFSLVELQDALEASKNMNNDLDRLRNRFK